MKRILLITILILLSKITFANVIINEIMYNPNQCSDNDCEWIEIYNNGNEIIDLSSWLINDNDFDNINISPSEYIVIAKELIDGDDTDNESFEYYWGNSDKVWNSTDANYTAIDGSFSLVNFGGTINITNGSYTILINYSNDWGADGDGYTLEKINPDGTNEKSNWAVSLVVNGTPGYQNSIYGTGEIDYSQIEVTEFLPDPEGYDDAPMPGGEWIELYNPTNIAMDLKWMFFKDLFGHFLYITDTTVSSTTIISPKSYLVVYNNGKSGFLNKEGAEILSFYDKSGNLIENVSFIDPVEGNSYAFVEDIGWQHTKPTPGEENINYSSVKDSYFDIIDVFDLGSDDIAKFGQTIRVKANIYKGDDTKNVVRVWIADKDEKISKESKISIFTKFTDYTLAVPVQLKPNCNEEYDDGDYKIFIGWTSESSSHDSFPLEVEEITNSLCKTIKVEKKASSGKFSYEIIEMPLEINVGKKFNLMVRLDNNDEVDIPIKIWSYVFRGPKSYSGDREENKKEFVLKKRSSDIVDLSNIIPEADPGDYRLKVVINKDNQKTNKEITEDIKIVSSNLENKLFIDSELGERGNKITQNVVKTTGIVYESTTEKTKKLALLFLVILSIILNVVLIWRR